MLIIFTSLGGVDYASVTNQTVTFEPSTSSRQCLNITTLPDSILENDETFSVSLNTADSDISIDPRTATVLIIDNDCKLLKATTV